MASTVATSPPELAIEAKQMVFNIITELELRALKTKANTLLSLEHIASTIYLCHLHYQFQLYALKKILQVLDKPCQVFQILT